VTRGNERRRPATACIWPPREPGAKAVSKNPTPSISYPATKPSVVVDWKLSCADRRTLRRTIANKVVEQSPRYELLLQY
jgi:hypothetical protein